MVARINRSRTYTKVQRMPKMYGAPRLPVKKRPRFRFIFTWLFWGGVAGGLIYVLLVGPLFRVTKVEVKGVVFSNPDTYAQKVALGQHIAFIPKEGIEYQIRQEPTVESVQLLRGLPDSVRIVITEKKPALLWISEGKASVLDEEGKVFLQYPENSMPAEDSASGKSLVSLKKVYDRQNMPVKIGQRVVSALFINFISSASKELAQNVPQYPLVQFEVTGSSFFDVQAAMQGGLTAELSVLADAGVQARNLARLLNEAKIPATSHVDLRIDRWAYVK